MENRLTTILQCSDSEAGMMSLEVVRKAAIADDVHLFELALAGRQPLPAFSAGSHVTVLTPNGMTRRYSLCNGPGDRDRYVIAVKREAQGRGGSVSLIDHVAVGDVLMVSAPLNYFPLDAKAGSHLLIAGGIGITPILSMVRELQARQAEFRVIYATRSPQATAFLELLCGPDFGGRVRFHHDHGDRTRSLELAPVLSHQPAGAHLYCCGPRPLMQAVRDCTRHWPAASMHFEDFGTSEQPEQPVDRPFAVRLVRTGVTVEVPAGVSILEALRRRGIAAPSSCESGTCGSCRTGLVAGIAQHRDYVLDEDQHDKEIMICVSRAESPVLDLDL